jgi:hypothetical protein
MLSNPDDAAFVRRLLKNLAARGDASVAELRVNGAVIAAQVLNVLRLIPPTPGELRSMRPTPDIRRARCWVDRITEQLLANPKISAVNSCAIEASFMGQLWSGRAGDGGYAYRHRRGKVAGLLRRGAAAGRLPTPPPLRDVVRQRAA